MVRNIIFDLGNVLVSFRPARFLEKLEYPSSIRKAILNDIFSSKYWTMLDNGDISTQEAIEIIAKISTLKRDLIEAVFSQRIDILTPMPSNIKLLPALKKQGLRLFYLSNFPIDLWEQVHSGKRNSEFDFFKFFDGGIISAEVRLSKPDPRFYRMLAEKYCLKPEECFFIDDIPANVLAAENFGMQGLVTYGSEDISADLLKVLG